MVVVTPFSSSSSSTEENKAGRGEQKACGKCGDMHRSADAGFLGATTTAFRMVEVIEEVCGCGMYGSGIVVLTRWFKMKFKRRHMTNYKCTNTAHSLIALEMDIIKLIIFDDKII